MQRARESRALVGGRAAGARRHRVRRVGTAGRSVGPGRLADGMEVMDLPHQFTGASKCRPPYRGKERWCNGLNEVLSDEANVGVLHVVALCVFKTGKVRVLGVAARAKASRSRTPVMFNRCPYCGEGILFATDKEKAQP